MSVDRLPQDRRRPDHGTGLKKSESVSLDTEFDVERIAVDTLEACRGADELAKLDILEGGPEALMIQGLDQNGPLPASAVENDLLVACRS